MRPSIRLKLIGFTMSIVLLVGGVISLHAVHLGRERILAAFERDARETADIISASLVDDLYFLNIRNLRSGLENARVNVDVAYTYVMDGQGVILADGTQANLRRDSVLSDDFGSDLMRATAWISSMSEDLLKVGGPVLMPDGRRIGYLLIGFSLGRVNQAVHDTVRASLYLTLFCFGLGAVLAFIAATLVSRPIAAITETAREIGKGKLDSRVSLKRADELGILAESINQMAGSLSATTVSRAYLDRILASMGDALIVLAPDWTIERVNQATLDLLGYGEAELIGRPLEVVCPEGLDAGTDAAGRPESALPETVERTYLAKDGRRIPVSFTASALQEGNGPLEGIVCVAQDITVRKQAEEALRRARDELEIRVQERTAELAQANEALQVEVAERRAAEHQLRKSREEIRALAAHLESAREEQRTRIARDIHDQLGQALTGLKMDLVGLARRGPESWASLGERMSDMVAFVDGMIQSVRRIYTELRPSVLDDLGLAAAIEWQAQEFQARTGVACDFVASPPEILTDPEVATALFRICQETLTNVIRHAGATHVRIRLMAAGDHVALTVEDNGRGFPEQNLTHKKSFGLLGIQERASLLGGEFEITGRPGQGVTVTARIPFKRPPARAEAREGS